MIEFWVQSNRIIRIAANFCLCGNKTHSVWVHYDEFYQRSVRYNMHIGHLFGHYLCRLCCDKMDYLSDNAKQVKCKNIIKIWVLNGEPEFSKNQRKYWLISIFCSVISVCGVQSMSFFSIHWSSYWEWHIWRPCSVIREPFHCHRAV